jgi:hypothetical protein
MSKAKDVLAELMDLGVMGGKVLPMPFMTKKVEGSAPPDTEELQEKIAHLGKAFTVILEKLDSLEGNVLGLKVAFQSAAQIWTGESAEEATDEDALPDEDDGMGGGGEGGGDSEGDQGDGEDGETASNSD